MPDRKCADSWETGVLLIMVAILAFIALVDGCQIDRLESRVQELEIPDA